MGRKSSHRFTNPVSDIAARLFARPHQKHPPRSLPEFEAEKRETFRKGCQPTLLLVHHQAKSRKLSLQLLPRRPRRLLRSRQQHHIIRITNQPHVAERDSVAPAPLTIYLVQKDV